jgi:hypothetical protein
MKAAEETEDSKDREKKGFSIRIPMHKPSKRENVVDSLGFLQTCHAFFAS